MSELRAEQNATLNKRESVLLRLRGSDDNNMVGNGGEAGGHVGFRSGDCGRAARSSSIFLHAVSNPPNILQPPSLNLG